MGITASERNGSHISTIIYMNSHKTAYMQKRGDGYEEKQDADTQR